MWWNFMSYERLHNLQYWFQLRKSLKFIRVNDFVLVLSWFSWTGDLPLLTFPVLTVTHKSPRGKGKQIFGQKEIKNYFPRKRKALQEAGKGGSAERFCEEEKGKCLKFSWNRDSQFIWSGRDWVPSPPANDPWKRMMMARLSTMVMARLSKMATKKPRLGRLWMNP